MDRLVGGGLAGPLSDAQGRVVAQGRVAGMGAWLPTPVAARVVEVDAGQQRHPCPAADLAAYVVLGEPASIACGREK